MQTMCCCCVKPLLIGLSDYGVMSGQMVNPEKSHIYFGKGVSSAMSRRITRCLGFIAGALPFIYLGVPIFVGRPVSNFFIDSRDKIINKFSAWQGLHLSMAGRICLVKSVIQSSPIHSMLVYKWPASIIKDLDKACRNFIWTGDINRHPACSVSWFVLLKRKGGSVFARLSF